MSDITLTFAADESAATEAFSNVGEAATGMGSEIEDSTSAFDSVGDAANGLRSPVRGIASTFRGVNSTMSGFGKIAEGDVMGGLQQVAMGASGLVRGLTSFLIPALSATVGWLKTSRLGMIAHAAGSAIASAATKVWSGIQAIFNAIMALNPVTLIIIAIVALVAVIILIATKTQWFQNIWKAIWNVIGDPVKKTWAWIRDTLWPGIQRVWNGIIEGVKMLWNGIKLYFGFWKGVFDTVRGWVTQAKDWIVGKFNAVVDFVRGLPGRVKSAASGLFNGIRDAFRSALNWIIGKWNSLSFTLPSINFLGQQIGGQTFRVPQIPRFHSGVDRVPGAPGSEMLAVLQAGEKVLPAGASGGGGITIAVERGGGSSTDQAVAGLVLHLVRTGAIRLTVRHGRVAVA